jgi:hypothetical protein
MQAQSLSINLQGPCNATCPFCISALTWHPNEIGNEKLLNNLNKALNFAKYHNVDTALITKSERGSPRIDSWEYVSILSFVMKHMTKDITGQPR